MSSDHNPKRTFREASTQSINIVNFYNVYVTQMAMISRKTKIKKLRGTGDFTRTLLWWDSLRGEFPVAHRVPVLISRSLQSFESPSRPHEQSTPNCRTTCVKATSQRKSSIDSFRQIIAILVAQKWIEIHILHWVKWCFLRLRSLWTLMRLIRHFRSVRN